MQSTIVMLVALTGMGCHHKSCDTCYEPASVVSYGGCYSGYTNACYTASAPSCYATAYTGCYGGNWGSSCYGGACYGAGDWSGSCYGGACYGGWGHHRAKKHRHGLFGCFTRNRCGVCNPAPAIDSCYGGWDSCYSQPVFGSYTTTYSSGQYGSSQGTVPTIEHAVGEPATPLAPADAAPATPNVTDGIPATPPAAASEGLPTEVPAVPAAPAPGDAIPSIPGGVPTEVPAVPNVPAAPIPGGAAPAPGF